MKNTLLALRSVGLFLIPLITLPGLVLATARVKQGQYSGKSGRNPADVEQDLSPDFSMNLRSDAPKFCTAVRGNGELILGHFNSYARLIEHFGLVGGTVGGSSASISSFIYESILQNQAVWDCTTSLAGAGQPCSDHDKALRVALLIKTIWAWVDTDEQTPEAKAIFNLTGTARKIEAELKAMKGTSQNVGSALSSNPSTRAELRAAKAEVRLLMKAHLGNLVNPELLAMLGAAPDTKLNSLYPLPVNPIQAAAVEKYRVQEVEGAIETFGKYDASSKVIFFRPGLISFPALAELFGRIGDFYAGRKSHGQDIVKEADMKAFLDNCAAKLEDKNWTDQKIEDQKNAVANSCDAQIKSLINQYRKALTDPSVQIDHPRLSDPIGRFLNVVVASGVLDDDSASQAASLYQNGRQLYRSGQLDQFSQMQFNVFDQLHYGYWGHPSDLALISKDPTGFASTQNDAKTKKRVILSQTTWRDIISHSPAEPGLSRFPELDQPQTIDLPAGSGNHLVGTAGWVDLAPTLSLKNMGCQSIVYVTRIGQDSPFGQQVASTLGMTPAESTDFYDVNNPNSSFSRSINTADGVWCTNWDSYDIGSSPNWVRNLDYNTYNGSQLESPLYAAVGTDMAGKRVLTIPPGFKDLDPSLKAPPTHVGCGGTAPVPSPTPAPGTSP